MSPESKKGSRIALGVTRETPIAEDAPEWAAHFTGDLKDRPISYLLKVAQHYELTGRLFLGSAACNVIVQFGLGRAVHASSPFSSGAEAIIDLFIWKTGKIRFESGPQPDKVSIQEGIEELLFRGQSYCENLAFLEQLSINEMSFLMRPPGRLADGEFEQRIAKGQRIDHGMQSEFYSNTYGTRNIKDTAEKLALPQSQWVGITANLLQLGLLLTPDGRNVQFAEPGFLPGIEDSVLTAMTTTTSANQTYIAEPEMPADHRQIGVPGGVVALDPTCIETVAARLTEPTTGILSFDSFQFFLCQEFARAYRFRSIFSVAIFCVRTTGSKQQQQSIPYDACGLLASAINQIKQDGDLLGHFGPTGFGLLLPNSDGNQAAALAETINKDLLKRQPALARLQPMLHFGIATIPYDSTDLSALVHMAQTAMMTAADQNLMQLQAKQVNLVS